MVAGRYERPVDDPRSSAIVRGAVCLRERGKHGDERRDDSMHGRLRDPSDGSELTQREVGAQRRADHEHTQAQRLSPRPPASARRWPDTLHDVRESAVVDGGKDA